HLLRGSCYTGGISFVTNNDYVIYKWQAEQR
ncbi:MAG: hypothetical protein K0Q51_1516, partial [Rickettsiaceae bacterium]|nr:hypothetical protein [Rickettsiaceae bacterium]